MRTTLLSIAALAALAVSSNTADAQYRGRGFVGRPYYGGYNYNYRPYYGGYSYGGYSYGARPYYSGYNYGSYYGGYPYYNNYVTPVGGFGLTIGSGYYPGYGFRW